MRYKLILGLLSLLLLLVACSPASNVTLPEEYKCQTRKCYAQSNGMIQVNALRDNSHLVDDVMGPIFFKSLGESLAQSDCSLRCQDLGYNLFATDIKKVHNRLTGEQGYTVVCLCAYLER